MDKTELSLIRHRLGNTQNQLAQLLGTSPKAIQSFEQGWRNIPAYSERQLLFLLALKNPGTERSSYCWVIRNCPAEVKQKCPAWQFQAGHLCWFINGTICQGEAQGSWQKKMKVCRKCQVFRRAFDLRLSEK